MKKTNFDRYLQEQMKDPAFAEGFERAGEAWDVALQLHALRRRAGISQAELARKLGTSQQQVCRLESPDYRGHSLRMLRRVAKVLKAKVHVVLEPLTVIQADIKDFKRRESEPTVSFEAVLKGLKRAGRLSNS